MLTFMELTAEEFEELTVLKKAINENPASVHWDKMERFGYLMVKSLQGKGDLVDGKPYSTIK
jgi:hypothetical protein